MISTEERLRVSDTEEFLHMALKYNKIKFKDGKNSSVQSLTEYFLPSAYLCFNAEEVVFALKPRESITEYEKVLLSEDLVKQIKKTHAYSVFAAQKKVELQTHMENTANIIEKTAASPHIFMVASIKALKYQIPEGYEYFVPKYRFCFNTTGAILYANKPRAIPSSTDQPSRYILFGDSTNTPPSYTKVILPETLIHQVLELHEATITAKSEMEILKTSIEFIAACASQEKPPELLSKRCTIC